MAAGEATVGGGDEMTCRSCGRLERASEGYPCADCGTFICLLCELAGVERCRACSVRRAAQPPAGA